MFRKAYPFIFLSATKSHLWNYLQFLLNDPEEKYIAYIQWLDKLSGVFKIVDPQGLARLWGQKKNIPKMNYDKMSRSLRNYYKNNKLKKVPGQRQVYQFIFSEENPAQIHPQVALYWQMIQTQLK
ncbi:transcription factor ETV7-like [Cylas formicarius]|uniref:transcription factor ETV7-like n=1 Tax=Cylas formicarius TaxID=197179 RepID=UPI0029585735|nr:transcription factor ETV7-like [Cylas formicarius]